MRIAFRSRLCRLNIPTHPPVLFTRLTMSDETIAAAAAPIAGHTVGLALPGAAARELFSGGQVFTLVFRCDLTESNPVLVLDIARLASDRLSFFESVRLVDLQVTVSLPSGTDTFFHVAARPVSSAVPATDCPVYSGYPGSANQAVPHWSLPPSFPFTRELKAPSVGNPRPEFLFGIEDLAANARLRIVATLQCSGYGVPSVLAVNPTTNSGTHTL